jgi:microsomal dipeptidase-like Zn-dependent dipeptidase
MTARAIRRRLGLALLSVGMPALASSISCRPNEHSSAPTSAESRPTGMPDARAETGVERDAASFETNVQSARDGGRDAESHRGLRPLAVVDFHVDLGWASHRKGARMSDPKRDASLERLLRGEVGTLMLPLFVEKAYARPPAEIRAEYDATLADAKAMFERDGQGKIGAPLAPPEPGKIRVRVSFEGADGFVDDPDAALAWLSRGACLFGLVHSRTNALGGASQDPDRKKRLQGLTEKGTSLARALVSHGALLDLAHASDRTADDLAAIAEAAHAPLVDSHTGARALVPIDRNLDDARIARVARSGGIVSLSLHSGHISTHPGEPATLDDVVGEVMHLRAVAGYEHVAIGSDLEGAIELPTGVDGAAFWPELARRLAAKGVPEGELVALFRGNGERVLGWSEAHGCGRDSLAK